MRERLIWMAVALASIWLSVALISVFAPDFVSGSEQEHIPLAALITWIPGLFATRSVLNEMVRRRQPGKVAPEQVWMGVALLTAGIWVVVIFVSIFAPRTETGSDPTRIPLGVIFAPIAGAIVTSMVCSYSRLLEEGPE